MSLLNEKLKLMSCTEFRVFLKKLIEDKIEKAADRCEDKVAKALENIEDACLTKEEIIELLYSLRDNPDVGVDGGTCNNWLTSMFIFDIIFIISNEYIFISNKDIIYEHLCW